MFSLSAKNKYKIIKPENAIYVTSSANIIEFGSSYQDLCVKDNSNIVDSDISYFGTTYQLPSGCQMRT